MMAPMDAPTSADRAAVAARIDHTLLRPEATAADVAELCAEATELGVAAVCVSPSMLPITAPLGDGIAVASVIGFPSGAHHRETKAAEAATAVADGATELDMVINLGLVKAGEWAGVEADIAAVRAAAPAPTVLKVIIESAALGDDEIVAACRGRRGRRRRLRQDLHRLPPLRRGLGGGGPPHGRHRRRAARVKASGGIRDAATATAMLAAGATRLGCSATRAILDGPGVIRQDGCPALSRPSRPSRPSRRRSGVVGVVGWCGCGRR
jgi:deoxyribose-phosphate aldolase